MLRFENDITVMVETIKELSNTYAKMNDSR